MSNEKHPTFTLDSYNLNLMFEKHNVEIKKLFTNHKVIHKIMIQNTTTALPKLNILKAVVTQANPYILFAMNINTENNITSFYCKSCPQILEKFCDDKLLLKVGQKDLRMSIIVGCHTSKDLNLKKTLCSLLNNRITAQTLNLENFNKIPGICNEIYCDITNPKIFNFIMGKLRPFNPVSLNLAHNNITTLKGFRFSGALEEIDISFNKINTWDDLDYLLKNKVKIKGINLSGNPLCGQFLNKIEYIQTVKSYFPDLENIDLKQIENLLFEIADFHFVPYEKSEYFIDQFMEHYFPLFDNLNRRKYLQQMYHPNAIFSLTSSIVSEKLALSSASNKFKQESHNLLHNYICFEIGPKNIIDKICCLPETEHDHFSFCVDVLHFKENTNVIFSITGALRESEMNPLVYTFNRTFALVVREEGEFQITNDLLHITNIQFLQNRALFKAEYRHNKPTNYTGLKIPTNDQEKLKLLIILLEVTALHVPYAKTYLEKNDWNLQKTLEAFVYDTRFDLITADNFMLPDIKQILFRILSESQTKMNFQKLVRVLDNLHELHDRGYLFKPKHIPGIQWRTRLAEIRSLLLQETTLEI